MVLISGEAGLGKTRLAEELLSWAEQQGCLTVHTRAYAAEGQLTYAPVIAWLRSPPLSTSPPRLRRGLAERVREVATGTFNSTSRPVPAAPA